MDIGFRVVRGAFAETYVPFTVWNVGSLGACHFAVSGDSIDGIVDTFPAGKIFTFVVALSSSEDCGNSECVDAGVGYKCSESE